MKNVVLLLFAFSTIGFAAEAPSAAPVRFAIFGLAHDHAAGFIPRAKDRHDIQLVGIIEPRPDLVSRYAKRFQLDSSLFFSSLDELLAKTNIQAVATFTSTFDHRRVVELCAALSWSHSMRHRDRTHVTHESPKNHQAETLNLHSPIRPSPSAAAHFNCHRSNPATSPLCQPLAPAPHG